MSNNRITKIIATTDKGAIVPFDVNMDTLPSLLQLMAESIKCLTKSKDDLSYVSKWIVNYFEPRTKRMISSGRLNLDDVDERLTNAKALDMEDTEETFTFFNAFKRNAPNKSILILTDVGIRKTYYTHILKSCMDRRELLAMDIEHLDAAFVGILTDNDYNCWFSLPASTIGDRRGLEVKSNKGNLTFSDGEAITIPHPRHGYNISGIVYDKFVRKYGSEFVATTQNVEYHGHLPAKLEVYTSECPPFVLDIEQRNLMALVILTESLARSISDKLVNIAFIRSKIAIKFKKLHRRHGIEGPVKVKRVDANLVAYCDNVHGLDVISPHELKIYDKTNLAYTLIGCSEHNAIVLNELKNGNKLQRVLVIQPTYLVGDVRCLNIEKHDGELYYSDGESVNIPHPKYGNDLSAIMLDKFNRLYMQ